MAIQIEIICDNDPNDFANMVNQNLKAGWKLYGDIFHFVVADEYGNICYSKQAMTLDDGISAESPKMEGMTGELKLPI